MVMTIFLSVLALFAALALNWLFGFFLIFGARLMWFGIRKDQHEARHFRNIWNQEGGILHLACFFWPISIPIFLVALVLENLSNTNREDGFVIWLARQFWQFGYRISSFFSRNN